MKIKCRLVEAEQIISEMEESKWFIWKEHEPFRTLIIQTENGEIRTVDQINRRLWLIGG